MTTIKVKKDDATTGIKFFDGEELVDWITFEVIHDKIAILDRGDLTLEESRQVAGGFLSKGEDEALARYLALKSEDDLHSILRKTHRLLEKDCWKEGVDEEGVPFWEKEAHFWKEDGSFSGTVTLRLYLSSDDGSWRMLSYCDHESLEATSSMVASEEIAKLQESIPRRLLTKKVQGKKVEVWYFSGAPAYEVDQLTGQTNRASCSAPVFFDKAHAREYLTRRRIQALINRNRVWSNDTHETVLSWSRQGVVLTVIPHGYPLENSQARILGLRLKDVRDAIYRHYDPNDLAELADAIRELQAQRGIG